MKKACGIILMTLIVLTGCGAKVPGIPQLGKVWNETEGPWTGRALNDDDGIDR